MSNETQDTQKIEKALEVYYQNPEPSARFLDRLEIQLTEVDQRPASQTTPESLFQKIFKKRQIRWAFAPAMIATLFVIVIAAIGPQKVIAQVQSWFNYVPGFGFVNLNATRVLIEPVSLSQGDMTVTVKQILSNQEGTFVSLNVVGGPSPEEYLEALGPATNENSEEWTDEYQELYDSSARLILPDGTVLDDYYHQGAYWDGYLTFETLPRNVLELTLELPRIPGLPWGEAPENWVFETQLVYVEEELISTLPETHVVDITSNQVQGVFLRGVDAIYSDNEVAIRVQIEGISEDWDNYQHTLDARLTDDLGNDYPTIIEPAIGLGSDGSYMVTFQPIRPLASQLTLSVINLAVNVPLNGQSFIVDFGDGAQIGDYFPIDTTIDALGIPVHISGVRIHDDETPFTQDAGPMTTFAFEIDPIPVQNGIMVMGIELSPETNEKLGSRGGFGTGGGAPYSETPGFTKTDLSISIPAGVPLPSGSFEFLVRAASIYLEGPFTITWEIE